MCPQLEFLGSLYRLEGTLQFSDTRELFDGFLVDYFRMQNAECVLRRSFDKWDVCENDANARLTVAREFYDVTEEKGIPAGGSCKG